MFINVIIATNKNGKNGLCLVQAYAEKRLYSAMRSSRRLRAILTTHHLRDHFG